MCIQMCNMQIYTEIFSYIIQIEDHSTILQRNFGRQTRLDRFRLAHLHQDLGQITTIPGEIMRVSS